MCKLGPDATITLPALPCHPSMSVLSLCMYCRESFAQGVASLGQKDDRGKRDFSAYMEWCVVWQPHSSCHFIRVQHLANPVDTSSSQHTPPAILNPYTC